MNKENRRRAAASGFCLLSTAGLAQAPVPHKLFGLPQILRFTLPAVQTVPTVNGTTSGVGDLNLIDLFLFKEGGVGGRSR